MGLNFHSIVSSFQKGSFQIAERWIQPITCRWYLVIPGWYILINATRALYILCKRSLGLTRSPRKEGQMRIRFSCQCIYFALKGFNLLNMMLSCLKKSKTVKVNKSYKWHMKDFTLVSMLSAGKIRTRFVSASMFQHWVLTHCFYKGTRQRCASTPWNAWMPVIVPCWHILSTEQHCELLPIGW